MSINFYDQTEKEKRLIDPPELKELIEAVVVNNHPLGWEDFEACGGIIKYLEGDTAPLKKLAGEE